MGDLGSIPGLGRSPGKGKGYPLQYSDLENSMYCIVHGVRKSWIWLSNFHFSLSKSLKTFKEHFSKYDSDNSYKFELERTLSRTNYFQDRNSSPAFWTDKIPNLVNFSHIKNSWILGYRYLWRVIILHTYCKEYLIHKWKQKWSSP